MKTKAYTQLIEGSTPGKRRTAGAHHLQWIMRCAWAVLLVVSAMVQSGKAQNVVTEWNENAMETIRTGNTHFTLQARALAIVHAAMFDAINGIDCRYTPVHTHCAAPPGASRRAAGIQAAYDVLVSMYPSQQPALDAKLNLALA